MNEFILKVNEFSIELISSNQKYRFNFWSTIFFRIRICIYTKVIYYLSFQNITFLINLMGELVYLLH